ncbi:hypothetical protein [Anaerobacillus sp. CMMVII]|uniref:hypothetical protein n=1 Tax=Anaerobacillus sp. CMMVII TaxID=2755588 RepID=UPI0021B75674|nr:hypothetical protein [Anaerobacillus sp. CMMVII]
MPKIKKGNRILNVADGRLKSYLKQGYDQINEESGEVIQHATGGKAVSIGEYNKALAEIKKLKQAADNDKMQREVEELKAEIKKIKSENTKLKKELEAK